MIYLLYLIFAIFPSLVWLSYYLRQDKKPESKRMIIKIFILGMIVVLPTIVIEKGAADLYNFFKIYNPYLFFVLYVFIGIAFIEESLKYLVVRFAVINNPEFDEPFDVLLYLIIAALGFAALENLKHFLYLQPISYLILPSISEIAFVSFMRMITATLFHALCSGILGYFIALSFYKTAQKNKLTILGIIIATLLHGIYNFSIMSIGGVLGYITIAILLISMALLLSALILKIKKLPSVCK